MGRWESEGERGRRLAALFSRWLSIGGSRGQIAFVLGAHRAPIDQPIKTVAAFPVALKGRRSADDPSAARCSRRAGRQARHSYVPIAEATVGWPSARIRRHLHWCN